MIRGLYELFYLLLWYGLFYGLAFLVLIILLISMVGNHPTVVDTGGVSDPNPQMVIESREVCLRIDGCRIVEGICKDCVVKDVYLLNESLTHLN